MQSTMQPASQTITDQAQSIFSHHPHLSHRKVACRKENDRVIIEGQVNSFFEKQLAQEALRELQGIEILENQLEVLPS